MISILPQELFKTYYTKSAISVQKLNKILILLTELCADISTSDENECNRKNEIISENEYIPTILEPFQKKIKDRIEEIWSSEDGKIFDNILLGTDITNTQSIEESIAYIKSSGRTEHKYCYIDALKGFNTENIALAKKYITWKDTSFFKKYYFQLIFCISGFLIKFNTSSDSFLYTMGNYILWIGIIYTIFSTIRTSKRKKAWKLLTVDGEVLHPVLQKTQENSNPSESNSSQNPPHLDK